MVFWIAVLIGGLFAWGAAQVGFFASWIMLFNLVLAAYLALFLSPLIIDSVPATTDTPYGYALVLLTVAIATLVTAYAICYTCLSGRTRIEFPALMDKLGAGVLGFFGGFLVSSFLGLVVSLTPLPEMEALRSLGLEAESQRATRGFLCWWCDVLHGFVGSAEASMTRSEDAVEFLLSRAAPPVEEIQVPAPPPQPSGQQTAPQPQGQPTGQAPGQFSGQPASGQPGGAPTTAVAPLGSGPQSSPMSAAASPTAKPALPTPAMPQPIPSKTPGPPVDPKTGPPIRFP